MQYGAQLHNTVLIFCSTYNVCNTDDGDGKDHTDVHFVLKNDVLLGAEEGAEAQGEDVSTSHAGLGGKE